MMPERTINRRTLEWSIIIDGRPYGNSLDATHGVIVQGILTGEIPDPQSPISRGVSQIFDITTRLKSIELNQKEEEKISIKMQFDNEDLKYFEDPKLMKGTEFTIAFGYPGHMSPIVNGKVDSIKGFTTLTVEAVGVESQFDFKQKNERHKYTTRAALVEKIAKRNGILRTVIDPSGFIVNEIDEFNQVQSTDRQFLKQLADEIGLVCYITLETGVPTLHFHRRKLGTPPNTSFSWRGGKGLMKDFKITENSILGKPQEVTVSGLDTTNRVKVEAKVNSLTTSKKSSLGAASEVNKDYFLDPETGSGPTRIKNPGAGKFDKVEKKVARPVETPTEAKEEAEGIYQTVQEEQIKAKATLIGSPQLGVGMTIQILGLPKMLAGNYIIKSVKQKFGNGFTTELELLRDAHSSLPVSQKNMVSSEGVTNTASPGDENQMIRVYSLNPETGTGPTALHVKKSHPIAQKVLGK
jgi:phage protein D